MRKKKQQRPLHRVDSTKLQPGEIVHIRSKFGLTPPGIFRVDAAFGDLVSFSVGEVSLGINREFVEVLARGLPEPACWLELEVQFRREQIKRCPCAECRSELDRKERELNEKRSPLAVSCSEKTDGRLVH